jgi:hypothetical protein
MQEDDEAMIQRESLQLETILLAVQLSTRGLDIASRCITLPCSPSNQLQCAFMQVFDRG